jgi:hypothetical protein
MNTYSSPQPGSVIGRIPDLAWGTFWEGLIILIAGATAVWSGHPWLFSSLGPTAYELAEKPELPSARTYNVVVGHFVAIGAGFTAVAIVGAWISPTINAHSFPTPPRLWAAVIAVVLTVFFNLLLHSGQPAALATALLVALGPMQTAYSALWLAVGVVIVAIIGEPIRRIRLKALNLTQQPQRNPLRCPRPNPPHQHNLAA